MSLVTEIDEISGMQPRRVLIVRLGSLGDGVLSVPALRMIGRWLRSFAESPQVTVLGREFGRDIFRRALPIDRFFSFDNIQLLPLFSTKRGLPDATFDLLGRPDLAIIWLREYEPLASKLKEAGCQLVLAGESFPNDDLTHMSDHLCRLLEPLGITDRDQCDLPISTSERRRGLSLVGRVAGDRRLALIHPGSGSQKKNWPAGNFAELMGKLANWGWDFRVLRGPADAQSVKNLLRAWDGIGVRVIEPESVSDLCGVLAAFDLVVSNDSGVAHLSAALGRPTVAVFGPTNVFRWVPRGAAAVAVPPKLGASWPSVEAVVQGCKDATGSRAEPAGGFSATPILEACRNDDFS